MAKLIKSDGTVATFVPTNGKTVTCGEMATHLGGKLHMFSHPDGTILFCRSRTDDEPLPESGRKVRYALRNEDGYFRWAGECGRSEHKVYNIADADISTYPEGFGPCNQSDIIAVECTYTIIPYYNAKATELTHQSGMDSSFYVTGDMFVLEEDELHNES